MRKLRTYVHLDGAVYGPHSEVPEEIAEKITNPKAWTGGVDMEPPGPVIDGQGDDHEPGVEDEDPPRPARNATVESWREYILAVADVTEADLDGLTKAQLIEMADQLDDDADQ